MGKTKQYSVWQSMKSRCNNRHSQFFSNYGDRGIRVCKQWEKFENFWDDMKDGYEEGLTLERIDNDCDYHPSNCRWATYREQQRNKTTNNILTLNGISKTLIEWVEETGIGGVTITSRLKRGWTIQKTLTTPVE